MRDNLLSWPSGCFASRSASDWLHPPPSQSGKLGGQVARGRAAEERALDARSRSLYLVPYPGDKEDLQEGFRYGRDKVQSLGTGLCAFGVSTLSTV